MSALPSQARRIAVIDDDAAVLSAVRFALTAEGYEVATYAGAVDALTDGLQDVDCLILDYKLPDMGGLDLLARLRGRGVTAPVILITTHPDRRCRRDAQSAGARIVEKPLMGDALYRQIRELLTVG